MKKNKIIIDGENLKLEDVHAVSEDFVQVLVSKESKKRIDQSRKMVDVAVEDEKIVYGVTTGFGPFVSVLIPKKYQTDLQENLIRSHASNVGPLFSVEETRAAMLLRINAFSKGYSGIRNEVVELLAQMLNKKVHPCIPQWGSVGASGDLTPSAHIALSLMGEGTVEYHGKRVATKEALAAVGLKPVRFKAKEGLALINGTTMMTGVGSLQLHYAWDLIKTAEIISGLAIEVLGGSMEPFLPRAHAVKPHPGQLKVVKNLNSLLKDSQLVWNTKDVQRIQKELQEQIKTHNEVFDSGVHVQNVYSLRAIPQILGAVRDSLDYATRQITTEMNSANDNPLFFPDLGISYQGAHFHGQPVALPMDVLSIALTEIGVLSERQLNKILDPVRNSGLSPFLAGKKSGLRCGLEGAQYIATALVAECRTLCVPASIQSIPSNGENQDVVSMGLIAARKARDIREKLEYILATELLAVCQALEEREKSKMSSASRIVYRIVRKHIKQYDTDRIMHTDIENARNIIHEGTLVRSIEKELGIKL